MVIEGLWITPTDRRKIGGSIHASPGRLNKPTHLHDDQLLALLPVSVRERASCTTIHHLDQAAEGRGRRRYAHAHRAEPLRAAMDPRQVLRPHPGARGRAAEALRRDPPPPRGEG